MIAFGASIAGSVALGAVYISGGDPALEGSALLAVLGGIGVGLVVWGRHVLDTGEAAEDRHPLRGSSEDRRQVVESIRRDAPVARRRVLIGLLGGAVGAFGAVMLFPIRSLGPAVRTNLSPSPWRAGLRLVDQDGHPVRLDDLPENGLLTAFPQGQAGSAQGQVAVLRVSPRSIHAEPGRESWSPDGVLAYSKVCTHAGCPVSLYLADSHQLLCPCHQSSFDALRGAKPVQGPAARPLPQLPIDVDADGVLRAAGDFSAPIGPAGWNHP